MFVLDIFTKDNDNGDKNEEKMVLITSTLQSGIEHSFHINESEESDSITFKISCKNQTDSDDCLPYNFTVYTPETFKIFKTKFNILKNEYEESLTKSPFHNLSNSGASGALFYRTSDAKFILKTVDNEERQFLIQILPRYLEYFQTNENSLLPKFVDLFGFGSTSINVTLVVMNNLFPPDIKIHQKYDLKGSKWCRNASKKELLKTSPTFKDNDFVADYPTGISLKEKDYTKIMNVIKQDSLLLKELRIMDYSILLGIHKIDNQSDTNIEKQQTSINVIPATNSNGDSLLLFIGIIDILQVYNLKKWGEHQYKSFTQDKFTTSVQDPEFYADRFYTFIHG